VSGYEARRALEHRAEGLWIENYLKVFGCEPTMTWEELSEEEREEMRAFVDAPSDGASSRPTGQLQDEPKPSPITDEMVEAGARALALARWRCDVEGVTQQERDQARACLEAAAAVRGERT
jgi:hypothetical protein